MGRMQHSATQALLDAQRGSAEAERELRELARTALDRVMSGSADQLPTGEPPSLSRLARSVFQELVDTSRIDRRDQIRFYVVCSEVARQRIMEEIRRGAGSGEGAVRLTTGDGVLDLTPLQRQRLEALDAALEELAALNGRLAQLLVWHYFGGLAEEDLAEHLDAAPRVVHKDLIKARGWIYRRFTAH